MNYIFGKRISTLYAVIALIVGLGLVGYGLSYHSIFILLNLHALQARALYAVQVIPVLLGVGLLLVAAVSYRVSSHQH